jgi:hypothetical protein
MDASRLELESHPDRRYKWNPRIGRSYFLGYHHGRVTGIFRTDEKAVHAFYAGGDNGSFVFFKRDGDTLRRYIAPSNAFVIFYSNGEDEPSFPAVAATFDREIGTEIIKDPTTHKQTTRDETPVKVLIMDQIDRWEEAERTRSRTA